MSASTRSRPRAPTWPRCRRIACGRRTARTLDGIKRSEWTRRAEEAQEAVAEAERELDELHEEARRADVPPGWFEADD